MMMSGRRMDAFAVALAHTVHTDVEFAATAALRSIVSIGHLCEFCSVHGDLVRVSLFSNEDVHTCVSP